MLLKLLLITWASVTVATIVGLLFFLIKNLFANKKQLEKKLRISKTIIPLEYTGKDYSEWMKSIIIERQILSIKNGNDFRLNITLTKNLLQENIFTINLK